MSVSVARCHFTEEVENDMRIHGDIRAADLCRDIRQWWYAEDDPGINSKLRIQQRMSLRKRLLSYVNFAHFPSPTMYINGWPCQLWEALIANIDAKTHLYGLTHSHTYNVRAFSSMMGETYFSELTMFDRRGRGTVTAAEFGRFICSTWQALNMRLDPERSFYYRTSRKTVYKLVDKSDMFSQNGGR
ncbi:uncharacterized protein LOC128553286 [Mercenaria mercenaria]|uniref:uncharacterized protein LOC128553286 n=1 Tax=Mercenaria mercenaria TaxID=6596 RepID=UPI00234F254D|nr:uncharacterized protein LOC128553286 [Mercenaria mercenaria]